MEIILKNVGRSVVDLTVRYIIVSSAKSRTLLLTESGRSFIYMLGKGMDPILILGVPQIQQVMYQKCTHLFILVGCDIVKMI